MIDLIERMDLAEVFDFDKFHDAFRQLRQAAKSGECLNIASYINDNPDFWNNYDITRRTQSPLFANLPSDFWKFTQMSHRICRIFSNM